MPQSEVPLPPQAPVPDKREIVRLLSNEANQQELFRRADAVRKENVGDEVHLRGLIEFPIFAAITACIAVSAAAIRTSAVTVWTRRNWWKPPARLPIWALRPLLCSRVKICITLKTACAG